MLSADIQEVDARKGHRSVFVQIELRLRSESQNGNPLE